MRKPERNARARPSARVLSFLFFPFTQFLKWRNPQQQQQQEEEEEEEVEEP